MKDNSLQTQRWHSIVGAIYGLSVVGLLTKEALKAWDYVRQVGTWDSTVDVIRWGIPFLLVVLGLSVASAMAGWWLGKSLYETASKGLRAAFLTAGLFPPVVHLVTLMVLVQMPNRPEHGLPQIWTMAWLRYGFVVTYMFGKSQQWTDEHLTSADIPWSIVMLTFKGCLMIFFVVLLVRQWMDR